MKIMNGPSMSTQKAKNFKGTFVKTMQYMRKDIVIILLAMVLAVGGVVAGLFVPKVLGGATDTLMTGAFQKTAYKQVVKLVNFDMTKFAPNSLVALKNLGDKGYLINMILDASNWIIDGTESEEELEVKKFNKEQIDNINGIDMEALVDNFKKAPPALLQVPINNFFKVPNAQTVGELAQLLNMQSMLDSVPEQYRGSLETLSLLAPPEIDVDTIVSTLLKILGLVAFSAICAYMQAFLLAGVAQRLAYRFRKDVNDKIDKLPLKFFDKISHGEIMSVISNDVDTLSTSLNQSISQILTSVTSVIGVVIMMLTINWKLTLIAMCALPIIFLISILVVKKSQKYFVGQQTNLGHVNGYIEEKYAGQNIVKLFNAEEESMEEFSKYNNDLCESSRQSQFYSGLMHPLMNLVGNINFVIVCVVGGMFVVQGSMSIGMVQAFIQYINNFNQPIVQLASVANTLQSTMASAERIFGFLEEEEEKETGDAVPQNVSGNVSFNNVYFGYDPNVPIIKNFNCEVKQGQRIAIVGPTGAGKTTIVKLLMRFYDLNSGHIAVDGRDIAEYTRDSIRESVGMVLQDTWLFTGTIRENIRYGNLSATDQDVENAAKIAYADHFIHTLPGGYDFVINSDASNVSQGQKQLLTIARAVLADNKIMILDEATSSVDTRTEVLIQQAMDKLMEGRTSFIIAHRLSTIKNADNILVLDKGDVVEQGTHKELLAKRGFYASLYNAQFEGGSDTANSK
ncbi:MAG: ABC transporter ATP-binding protein [Clostridia bacterium]